MKSSARLLFTQPGAAVRRSSNLLFPRVACAWGHALRSLYFVALSGIYAGSARSHRLNKRGAPTIFSRGLEGRDSPSLISLIPLLNIGLDRPKHSFPLAKRRILP